MQTDDDASRAAFAGIQLARFISIVCVQRAHTILEAFTGLIAALKKAADDAEAARKLAEESIARQLQVWRLRFAIAGTFA